MLVLQDFITQTSIYLFSKREDSESDDKDDDDYVRLFFEYVLFLSPSIIFLPTALYALKKLRSMPSGYLGDFVQSSLLIKSKLCKLESLLYLIQLLIAHIFSDDAYWICEYSSWSFMYLFGIGAWYFNSKLLLNEAGMGIPQGAHHKIFWTMSLLFSIWRSFSEDEDSFLAIILNLSRSLSLLILVAYIYFKPFDSDTAENEAGLGSLRVGFRKVIAKIEETRLISKIAGVKDFSPLEMPLLQRNSSHENASKEYQEYLTQEEAQNWLRHLSLLECSIRQIVGQEGTQVNVLYEITTKVEDDKFVKFHKYADFLYLEEYINKRCDPSRAPWIDRDTPDLVKHELTEFPDNESFVRARIHALEKYLSILTADPRYMIEPVIEFLGIQDPYKKAYLGYNGYLKLTSHKEKLTQKYQSEVQEIELKKMKMPRLSRHSSHKVDDLPFFTCVCKSAQIAEMQSHYEYIFLVSDQNDPTKVTWTITKSYKDFKDFHQNLEKVLSLELPIFERLVPKVTDQKQTNDIIFINKRKEGLEKYLNHILKNRTYYKDILYEFLEYHNTTRKDSSKNVTPRSSFFEGRNSN